MDKIIVEVGSTCTKVDRYNGEKIEKLEGKTIQLKKHYNENKKLKEEDVKTLIENNIILTIGSKEAVDVVDEVGQELEKKIKVHLKIDTGFGRYGFLYDNRDEMIKCLKKVKNIKIEGTYTHF